MKFKEKYDWRDLEIKREDKANTLTVCIDIDKTVKAKHRSAFIHVVEGDGDAAFHLTRKELRALAKAITKAMEDLKP